MAPIWIQSSARLRSARASSKAIMAMEAGSAGPGASEVSYLGGWSKDRTTAACMLM